MLDTGSTEVRGGAGAAHLEIARRTAVGLGIAVVVQYALGIWVNLYVTVPARDQGGGFLTAIGRALANGPVALGIHAGLGLLLVLGSISLVVRSVLSRHRALIARRHRDIEVHPYAQRVLDNHGDPQAQGCPPRYLQVGSPGAAAHFSGTRVDHRRHLRCEN